MEIIKKNITLVLGMSIPILMILFVAGSIYLPGLFVKPPSINFLYSSVDSGDYYCGDIQQYSVQNGQLIKNEIKHPEKGIYMCDEPKLFIQDVVKNESKQISFDEAKKLNLDNSVMSSDGFEVVYGSRGEGFFPFFFYSSTNYDTRYLKGHNISKKLNIQLNGVYSYSFHFIGWIKN
ncbi:MAG: hypothetical protein WC998_00075 [Candidatus Paceibacterota bacterium]|jgi:hypothetical protein